VWNCNHERSRAAITSEAARKVSSCDSVASASKAAIARTRGLLIVDLRRDAVAAKIRAAANEPIRAGPGSELSHVCAGGDLDGELGIEGLGETVKHPETRYGAASFKPGYG
jgi:hypothetical protein